MVGECPNAGKDTQFIGGEGGGRGEPGQRSLVRCEARGWFAYEELASEELVSKCVTAHASPAPPWSASADR